MLFIALYICIFIDGVRMYLFIFPGLPCREWALYDVWFPLYQRDNRDETGHHQEVSSHNKRGIGVSSWDSGSNMFQQWYVPMPCGNGSYLMSQSTIFCVDIHVSIIMRRFAKGRMSKSRLLALPLSSRIKLLSPSDEQMHQWKRSL